MRGSFDPEGKLRFGECTSCGRALPSRDPLSCPCRRPVGQVTRNSRASNPAATRSGSRRRTSGQAAARPVSRSSGVPASSAGGEAGSHPASGPASSRTRSSDAAGATTGSRSPAMVLRGEVPPAATILWPGEAGRRAVRRSEAAEQVSGGTGQQAGVDGGGVVLTLGGTSQQVPLPALIPSIGGGAGTGDQLGQHAPTGPSARARGARKAKRATTPAPTGPRRRRKAPAAESYGLVGASADMALPLLERSQPTVTDEINAAVVHAEPGEDHSCASPGSSGANAGERGEAPAPAVRDAALCHGVPDFSGAASPVYRRAGPRATQRGVPPALLAGAGILLVVLLVKFGATRSRVGAPDSDQMVASNRSGASQTLASATPACPLSRSTAVPLPLDWHGKEARNEEGHEDGAGRPASRQSRAVGAWPTAGASPRDVQQPTPEPVMGSVADSVAVNGHLVESQAPRPRRMPQFPQVVRPLLANYRGARAVVVVVVDSSGHAIPASVESEFPLSGFVKARLEEAALEPGWLPATDELGNTVAGARRVQFVVH